MDSILAGYTGALILSSCFSLGLAVMAFFRQEVPGARAFLFGNFASLFYALGSVLEIHAQTSAELLTALTTEYLGIATIGPFLFLTAVSATRGTWAVSRFWSGALFVIPGLLVVIVATNNLHHLFYTSVYLSHRGPFTVPILGKGPFYMVNMAYMNLCLFWGVLIAFRELRKARGAQRPPLFLLLLAALFPWGGMLIYQLGLSPWGLDTAPFGLTVSGFLFAVALFRFRLFDLTPLMVDQVFANMREGVMVIDQKGRLVGVNPALTHILPQVKSSRVGQSVADLAAEVPALADLTSGPQEPGFGVRIDTPEGPRTYQVDRSPLQDQAQKNLGTIYLLSDITQREELAARLALMARSDELTGLPNRRAFQERLDEALARQARYGETLGLALADIDHFKNVNDSLGHDGGDAALVHVTQIWKGCLRATDLAARYGGEEFTVLLPQTGREEALVLLERLRSRLEDEPLVWEGKTVRITASFGLVVAEAAPQGRADGADLVHRADRALYRAKALGRNQVRYDGESLEMPGD